MGPGKTILPQLRGAVHGEIDPAQVNPLEPEVRRWQSYGREMRQAVLSGSPPLWGCPRPLRAARVAKPPAETPAPKAVVRRTPPTALNAARSRFPPKPNFGLRSGYNLPITPAEAWIAFKEAG